MTEPSAEETETVDKTPPMKRLLRLFRYTTPYLGRLVIAIVALLIAGGLGLVYPKFFGTAIDAAFTIRDELQLKNTALLLVGIFAVQGVFVFIRHYLMSWLGERVVADLRVEVYDHLVTMPQTFFLKTRTGELLSRLGDDVTRLQDIIGQDLSMALRNVLTLVGGIIILFVLNPVLTGAMLAVVPALVIAASVWGRIIRKLSRKAQDELAQANGALQEGLAAIDTVQAFTREGYEVKRYGNAIAATFELFVKRIVARSWFMTLSTFFAFATIAGIFYLGGQMVIDKMIEPGELAEFFFYTMAVAAAVGSLAGLFGRFQQALGATSRIFEILDTEPTIADPEQPVSIEDPKGRLVFRDLTFAYEGRDQAVLEQFNLEVPAGKTCALVGSSGSGKTTVGRLAYRFWDPQEGAIELDGVDIRSLRLADLRQSMALVSQEPVLFSGTIRENIRYGRLDASDAEVEAAAAAANAHDFVMEFPDAYETKVGERGVKLSGGQRQRISIARALLRDPTILILDEATSALDSESEHLVQEALDNLQQGRTTVVIAHRLSTIRDADEIVVLEAGKIAQRGTHDELLEAGGPYARLIAIQAGLHETREPSHAASDIGAPAL